MPSIFLVSDTHFGHKGVTHFLKEDGTKLRPWDNPDEMDEALVQYWNEIVKPKDKVYHLGDVVINRKALKTLALLNGDKVLIKGNHDNFHLDEYMPYFRDIRAYHVMDKMILSHIPVHPESKGRFAANIHGHLHANRVRKAIGFDQETNSIIYDKEIDPWYFNVSVEQTNFRPILFEECLSLIEQQNGEIK